MTRVCLSAALVLIAATQAQAKLEIQNIQAAHGPLGPERKSLDCYPFDEVFFRYVVTGAKVDEAGKVDAELAIKLTDTKGTVLFHDAAPISGVLALGGGSFPGTAQVTLNDKIPPGKYILTVTIKDNLLSQEASFRRELNLKPVEFAIVSPRFFYDPEAKVPAPVGGLTSQTLYFNLLGVGFDRSQAKIDTEMQVQLFDQEGRGMMPRPIQAPVRSNDPDIVKQAPHLTFRGQMALNRAGDFTLRITITDRVGKQTATFEAPLHVTAP